MLRVVMARTSCGPRSAARASPGRLRTAAHGPARSGAPDARPAARSHATGGAASGSPPPAAAGSVISGLFFRSAAGRHPHPDTHLTARAPGADHPPRVIRTRCPGGMLSGCGPHTAPSAVRVRTLGT
ncbi:hypothetical protein LK06_030120 [Streptomyces pluripotens]|nr:hypothetical protein LK06_030120 [Streptomyces pluripotens]